MRFLRPPLTPLRRLALLGAAFVVAVLSCGREAGAPTAPGSGAGVRYARTLAIQPVFPPILTQTGGASGLIPFDHVHLVLLHADGTIALDTLVFFPPGGDQLTLTLTVLLSPSAPATGEPLTLTLDYVNADGVTVFHGGPVTVTAVPTGTGQEPPPPFQVPVIYTGPGAAAVSVRISPKAVTVFAGDPISFTAQAFDASNAVVPATPIFFTVTDGPATVNLNGSGTAGATRGTAHVVAQLITLQTDVATLTVSLRASALALVSGSAQVGMVGSVLGAPVVVRVTATDGVGVGGVSVSFATGSGGSVGSASVVTDASGNASTTWMLGPTQGPQALTVSAGSLTGSPLTVTATATPKPATKLVFTSVPTTTPAATGFGVTVTAQDVDGTPVPTFTGVVALALTSAPAGGGLAGSTTATAVAGVATFSGLTLNLAGTGYVLTASSGALTNAVSGSITATAGPATNFIFTTGPANIVAGQVMPPVVVTAKDVNGNVATAFTGTIIVTLGSNPGGGMLSGSTSAAAVAGVATFSGLSVNRPGVGYTLFAGATGIGGVMSGAFTVAVGPPASCVLVSGNTQTAAVNTTLAPIVVAVADAAGNPVPNAGVTAAVIAGGGSLASTTVSTNAQGQASFVWKTGPTAGPQALSISCAGKIVSATATAIGGGQVNYTWTGATSTSWTDPTNWSPAGVPGPPDSVYVSGSFPPNYYLPAISTPVTIKSLVLMAGCSPNLTLTSTLTIAANLIDNSTSCLLAGPVAPISGRTAPAPTRFPVANSVSGGGTVILTGTGNLAGSVNGTLLITGGTHTVVGYLNVDGDATLSGAAQLILNTSAYVSGTTTVGGTAQLNLNGNYFATGNFVTSSSGTLKMTVGGENLYVYGDATFGGGSTAGLLTAGTIDVGGNFTEGGGSPAAFSASGLHYTLFAGYLTQLISFADPGSTASSSHFANLDICNPAFGVTVHTDIYVTSQLQKQCVAANILVARDASLGATVAPTLHLAGVNVNTPGYGYIFDRVRVAIVDGSSITAFNGATFQNFTATTGENQFEVHRSSGGPFTFDALIFLTSYANTYNYAGVFGPVTVNLTNTTPALAAVAGKIFVSGGGTLNWTPASVATQLVFSTPPVTTVAGVSIAPAIVVQAQDAGNALVTSYIGNVMLYFGANPGASTLSGSTTVAAVAGIATFSNISLNHASAGYTLVASSGALTPATSPMFAITSGPLATITVTPTPATLTIAGTQQFTAVGKDANGNVVAITPTWSVVASGGTINSTGLFTAGTTPGTFTNTITATSGAISGTATVTVTAGPLATITVTPNPATLAINGAQQFTAVGMDANGNPVAITPTWTVVANGGTISATGLFTAGTVSGTFTSTVHATSGALSGTATVTVTAGAATTLAISGGNGQSDFAGALLPTPLRVTITDAFANVVPGVTVNWAALTGGGSVGAPTSVTNALGVATITWTLGATLGSQTATAIVTGTTGSPATFTANASAFAFASLTEGRQHTCGLTPGGAAYCWGWNTYSQLGDGTTTNRLTPVAVHGGLVFTSLTADSQTCGLTAGGAAYCWGDNTYSQLGDGTTTNGLTPVAVQGGLVFTSLTAGTNYTCGLTPAGAAYCWGGVTGQGDLGNGTWNGSLTPVAVQQGGLVFTSLTAGNAHTCGLTPGGAAYCWGDNTYSELGDGTTTFRLAPVAVNGGLVFTSLTAGNLHTCGLITGGAAYCWGYNTYGQLGDGTTTNRLTPVAVQGGLAFTSLTAGNARTCGLTTGGAAYCWGYNSFGVLGDGTTTNRLTPVAVQGGLVFTSLAVVGQQTCGLTTGGAAYCWGSNSYGNLGDGTTTSRSVPTAVIP